jgi:hypothetical protein
MSVALLDHPEPWSEDEYLALGRTPNRVELIDGSLWVGPAPASVISTSAFLLAMGLHGAAERAGLLVLQDVNLRLTGGQPASAGICEWSSRRIRWNCTCRG